MGPRKILLADDDPHVLELLTLYLKKEGFIIFTAPDGKKALKEILEQDPHLVILDIMMPYMDGWEVASTLRQEGNNTPIILLTAKGEDYDKILGLELGADDYVTKPFNPVEVVARVKAVLRRVQENPSYSQHQQVLKFSGMTINRKEYKALVLGVDVELTPKELELLYFLALNKGQVFSREQLLDQVWGYTYIGDMRTVDVHIKRIRQKLKTNEELPWHISTVWGVGYRFEVEKDV